MLGNAVRSSVFVLAAVVASALPSAAAASNDGCGQTRSVVYAATVPAAFRSTGVHRFQWRDQFTDESGQPVVSVGDNQIAIVQGASIYRGDVLLRFLSNWARLPDGSTNYRVVQIDPSQQATFYLQVGLLKGSPLTDVVSLRWEGAPGQWSEWATVAPGPIVSPCSLDSAGIFLRSRGWIQ